MPANSATMDIRDDAPQTSDDIGKASNAFVELGWPLAITICGTIIAFGVLGNFLVWWTRRRAFYCANSSTTLGYRDLESQSVRDRPLLPSLRSRLDKRVLVKKRHLRSRVTLSNFTWESTSDCATMRSLPALPVLPKYNAFESGRTSTSTNGAELAELRNSRNRRRSSTKSGGELRPRRRSTRRPPLPVPDRAKHELRNWGATDPTIHRTKSRPHEPQAKTNQMSGLQKVQRCPLRGSPDGGEGDTASASVTPTISLGTMPHYSKPIRQQREDHIPLRDTEQSLEASYAFKIPRTPKMGVQDAHSLSPTAASVSHMEGTCLTNLPTEPPQVLRRGMLPWTPGQMAIDSAESSPHVRTYMDIQLVANHSSLANPFRSAMIDVSTASRGVREQRPAPPDPNHLDHEAAARSGESDLDLPSQGHQRHQRVLSLASGTSSARSAAYSAIISQYEPFYLQNLLTQPSSTPPPHQQHAVATPAVNWSAWRQLDKQRPLSRAKTASWASDAPSLRTE